MKRFLDFAYTNHKWLIFPLGFAILLFLVREPYQVPVLGHLFAWFVNVVCWIGVYNHWKKVG